MKSDILSDENPTMKLSAQLLAQAASLVFIPLPTAKADGILVYKTQPFHSNELAHAFIYQRIESLARTNKINRVLPEVESEIEELQIENNRLATKLNNLISGQ